MTLTLTLSPDREARLHEQARQAGLSLEEFALRALDGIGSASVALPDVPSLAQRLALLHETPPVPAGRIPLSDEALRRESLYADDER